MVVKKVAQRLNGRGELLLTRSMAHPFEGNWGAGFRSHQAFKPLAARSKAY